MRHTTSVVLLTLSFPLLAGGVGGPADSPRLAAQGGQEASATQQEGPASAEGPTRVHPEARQAIDRLKSPFCPGLMLEVCPSPQAAEMRDSLDALAHRGVESDSLVAMVLDAYGEEWRAVPEARGGGLVAWLMPPLVLLLGVIGLIVGLRRFTGSPSAPEGPDVSEEERRRLDAAMHEMEVEEEPLF